jgi:hypothetical protein
VLGYRLVRAHYTDVHEGWEEQYEGHSGFLRSFTDKAVDSYFDCGVLAKVSAHVRCEGPGLDISITRRGTRAGFKGGALLTASLLPGHLVAAAFYVMVTIGGAWVAGTYLWEHRRRRGTPPVVLA